ncbi:MAG: hypothetical protein NVS9B15_06050 [Acidobacteriaceae bacterium]
MGIPAAQAAQGKLAVVTPQQGERLSVLGDQQRILITGAETNGAYVLVEQTNRAGATVAPHYHTREFEMFHVIEGTVRYVAGGQTIDADRERPFPYRREWCIASSS